jgi:four helix bundle protein
VGAIKTYKDLKVWQKAFELTLQIIEFIDDSPKQIVFNVVFVQLLRSTTSIGANIAEGYGSFSRKEYRRYLGIALKSAYETDNWLMTIKHSKVFQKAAKVPNSSSGIHPVKKKVEDFEKANIEIIKMLIALMKKLE